MNEATDPRSQPEPTEVTVDIPDALRYLIEANNKLLKNYKMQLMQQVYIANEQMMEILKLSPDNGWQLDIDRLVYTRPITEEELVKSKGK